MNPYKITCDDVKGLDTVLVQHIDDLTDISFDLYVEFTNSAYYTNIFQFLTNCHLSFDSTDDMIHSLHTVISNSVFLESIVRIDKDLNIIGCYTFHI